MAFAEVLVFRGVPRLYTYAIPDEMANGEDAVGVGDTVQFSLGRGEAKGLVMTCLETFSASYAVKPLKEKVASVPRLSGHLCRLICWFYEHYCCHPYVAYQAVVGRKRFRDVAIEASDEVVAESLSLNDDQQRVVETLTKIDGFKQCLLHGVTGSGKTEVYIHLATATIAKGKQVIILLPEIALTPQFREVFTQRFGSKIAIIHSGLTPKQRDEAWSLAVMGAVDIVIGPRSAVFSPLDRLGLLIIDEAHENTYKQDSHPRYFTEVVARWRCRDMGALLVLGSATPNVDTYYSFLNDSEDSLLLSLPNRVMDRPLPAVKIVDIKSDASIGPDMPLALELMQGIKTRMEKGEKSLILLNRRGFAPYVVCQACQSPCLCPECQLSFTYHKDRVFRCHRCDISRPMTHRCDVCGKSRLAFSGLGIQKVEMLLKREFPEAKVFRLDRDTAKTAKQLEKTLQAFKDSGDILLGTQLIAKGHHIEDVTLVGVLGIDTTLSMPDFHSPEQTFQLLTQVAGRAGRGDQAGEVFIQTAQPQHYAIQHASRHDFLGFYEAELAFREPLKYPPYSDLVNVIVSGEDAVVAKRWAEKVGGQLREALLAEKAVSILGPRPAPIEKVRDFYRFQILLKVPTLCMDAVKTALQAIVAPKNGCRFIVDYDPRQLL